MKAISVNSQLYTGTIRTTRTVPLRPFAALARTLGKIATAFNAMMERQAAEEEEKSRQRAVKRYRRNRAVLPSGVFRFDPRRDDPMARADGQ